MLELLNNPAMSTNVSDIDDIRRLFFEYWRQVEGAVTAVDLGMGMPAASLFPASIVRRKHLIRGIAEDRTAYQPPGGSASIRKEIALFDQNRTGLETDERSVMVVAGALRGFSILVDLLVSEVDVVFEVKPSYPLLAGQIREALRHRHISIRSIELAADGIRVDIDALIEQCESRTLIYLTNPCNPTGLYVEDNALVRLMERVEATESYLVIDEACDIPLGDKTRNFDWARSDRVIRINSFSKSLLLAGVRLGYVVGSPAMIQQLSTRYAFSDGNAPTIANRVLAGSLNDSQTWSRIAALARSSTERTLGRLAAMDGVVQVVHPEACYYVLFRTANAGSSWSTFEQCLASGVNVVPGELFGFAPSANWLRICCAREEAVLDQGLDRLSESLKAMEVYS
jgi:aspartate/methionine/tyrosine aminotransferase